ncbi:MAG: carboxypeptidase regulatory-like domain-containing protein [Candidatus Zixiibacteriota bacterium]
MKRNFLIGVLSLALLLVLSGVSFAQFGSISGRVTDDSTGLPIMGAHVWAKADTTQPGGYGFDFTDSSGYYMIDSLYAGEFLVFANALAYEEETYPESVIVIAGQNTPDIDFALTATGSPEYGSISGRVTDQVTSLPIIGAHLVATGVDTYCFGEAWSDSDGYYILEDLCVGIWQVQASKPGYYSQIYHDTVSVLEGQTTPGIDFALTPFGSPELGSISGRVTDEVSGYPIEGAAIILSGLYGVWYTDSTGGYMCDSIPVGGYWITANAIGYQQETYPDSVIVFEGQNTSDIDFALTPTGSPEYGSISGWVSDDQTGLPIIMAHVIATGLDNRCVGEAWSDSNGYYILEDLCVGIWRVQVSKSGYYTQVYPDTVSVFADQTTPDIDFALTPVGEMGSISGRVTDQGTDLPLPMAHLLAYDSTHIIGDAWTDTAGLYLMQNLPAGQYIVAVHKDGYQDEVYPESVIINEGQNTTDIDFALTPGGAPDYGSISGRVTDQVTGRPLMGTHLVATGLDTYCFGEAWSDSNGYYIIENLCAGIWQVQASKPDYHPQVYPDTLSVLEGQTTPGIDFSLTPTGGSEFGSISGRVGDEHTGLPLIEAHLVATGLDNYCFGEAWSDTGGNYTILDLCPGTYQVRVCYMGYIPETYPEAVIVESGQNTFPINFDLIRNEEPGSISGRVTDQITGDPIETVHLIGVEIGSWCIAHAWTNSYGNYILQGLWPGTWMVRGEKYGYLPGTYPDSVIVVEGRDTPDIDLALIPEGSPPEFGSISGQVTDEETGLPIIMAEITLTGIYYIWYTDTSGFYFCDSLPPGAYFVNAQKEGYVPETYPDSVMVTAGEITSGIDFYLTATRVGDVNLDYEINVSDVIYLVNYLFKNSPAPVPMEKGDINCNGTVTVSDIVYLINYIWKNGPEPGCLPTGSLIDFSGCKTQSMETFSINIPPDQDCVQYDYDGESVLLIKHINAGFNCCPDEIIAHITAQDNIITIQEDESLESGGCHCLCLFDVDLRITKLKPGEYTIKVLELYLDPNDEPLEFTVDLISSPSGTYCIERDHYPWGVW